MSFSLPRTSGGGGGEPPGAADAVAAFASAVGIQVLRCVDGQLTRQNLEGTWSRTVMPADDFALSDTGDYLAVLHAGFISLAVCRRDDGSVLRKPSFPPHRVDGARSVLACAYDQDVMRLAVALATESHVITMELSPRLAIESVVPEPSPEARAVAVLDLAGAPRAVAGNLDLRGARTVDVARDARGRWVAAAVMGDGVLVAEGEPGGTTRMRHLVGAYRAAAVVRGRTGSPPGDLVVVGRDGDIALRRVESVPAAQPAEQADADVPQSRRRVFVSFSHASSCRRADPGPYGCCANRALARWVVDMLESAQIEASWEGQLRAGDAFDVAIQKWINEADAVVVLWTDDSVDKWRVSYDSDDGSYRGQPMELNYMGRRLRGRRPPRVIPLVADGTDAAVLIETLGLNPTTVIPFADDGLGSNDMTEILRAVHARATHPHYV